MKIYKVNNDYVDALADADKNVMFSKHDDSIYGERRYVGVVLEIDGIKYFAPLSSPKKGKDFYSKTVIDGKGNKISKIIIAPDTIYRLHCTSQYANGRQFCCGTIRIGKMIPVPDGTYQTFDLATMPNSLSKKGYIKTSVWLSNKGNQKKVNDAAILINTLNNRYGKLSIQDNEAISEKTSLFRNSLIHIENIMPLYEIETLKQQKRLLWEKLNLLNEGKIGKEEIIGLEIRLGKNPHDERDHYIIKDLSNKDGQLIIDLKTSTGNPLTLLGVTFDQNDFVIKEIKATSSVHKKDMIHE